MAPNSESVSTEKRPYEGSCHCGAIRFTASDIDIPSSLSRCNCSICHKSNLVLGKAPVQDNVSLRSPSSFEKVSGQYAFGEKQLVHYFCKTCGIRPFVATKPDENGRRWVWVNVVTLEGVDLSTAKVPKYWNGKCYVPGGDFSAPADKPFPPGAP